EAEIPPAGALEHEGSRKPLFNASWLHFTPGRVVLSSVIAASTVWIDSSLDACVHGGIDSATIDSGAPALVSSFVWLLFHCFDLKTNNMDGCVKG
ncbi:MAG: hypothetical protein KQI81_24370, partial [Deltaproteobacteria bacterium]|nr:hypothetical protein [Deltaproteobacteria bacterium]